MLLPAAFSYDHNAPLDIREVGTLQHPGYRSRELTYGTVFGYRRAAEVFLPDVPGPFAAILYVHWLAESPNANRSLFVDEATHMAQRGVASLLIETMWSDRDWFIKRTQSDDYSNSIRQVIELRQAMDVLLAQAGVDPHRLAYVGHDFGAMYGTVMGRIDPRPRCYVLMAPTPHFPDWYLYYPPLEEEERDTYIQQMMELDPVTHVAHLAPAPILFQYARQDEHVPEAQALLLYRAAGEPKQMRWYEADHALNEAATQDRIAWLSERLHSAHG